MPSHSATYLRFADQVLYTALKFGEVGMHFIVAVVSAASFQDCVDMRLPCFNATPQVSGWA